MRLLIAQSRDQHRSAAVRVLPVGANRQVQDIGSVTNTAAQALAGWACVALSVCLGQQYRGLASASAIGRRSIVRWGRRIPGAQHPGFSQNRIFMAGAKVARVTARGSAGGIG